MLLRYLPIRAVVSYLRSFEETHHPVSPDWGRVPMYASVTKSNGVRNSVIGLIAALLLIVGLSSGSATDNGSAIGSATVSVSTDADSSSLGQVDIQEAAGYATTMPKMKFIAADGGYFIFKKATGYTMNFLNPNGWRFTQGSCYSITYIIQGGNNVISGRSPVSC